MSDIRIKMAKDLRDMSDMVGDLHWMAAKAVEDLTKKDGEIAKRDEELAACRIAVENCEVFRARIAELEARIVWLECEAQVNAAPVSETKAQGVVMPERAIKDGGKFSTELKVTGWNACLDEVARLNAAPVQQVSVPTHKMILAGEEQWERSGNEAPDVAAIFRAMLAAAPAAPAADAGLVEALEAMLEECDPMKLNCGEPWCRARAAISAAKAVKP